MHQQADPLNQVFAFQAFDFRNRFPDPLTNFRAALECLQSEDAYMPDVDAQIRAHLKDGRSIAIPKSSFWVEQKQFASSAEAEAWVLARQKMATTGSPLDRLAGSLIANLNVPVEKQVCDAMAKTFTTMVSKADNEAMCESAESWSREAIRALPKPEDIGAPNDD
ncbi:hypothetical protein MIH18_05640 [Marinobacter sp. M3C]|uniref:hypothetical protein n=1 Tax=unclassified Marinobacter TaxID=83889 RepID=UPI00200D9563|nr:MULTISPECIES: hypothetical protein [unclassified Marinobacter]MCL1477416.1 hypothetical protein [Marinobacter sp.]UQG57397.1 hypothetical protein MIH16_07080 [Marinobacter sp. M4C]UQG61425.1 hypothetical protein MIH18_05640 [Marinobacter sp. M3C]UQG66201.1 hypothetical protein MIH17_07080 [Marinobacter sp. M2C]UQG70481.1 hypothetical protein MIH19_07075 [Marinobacter sp. M1C]